jgi:hypothetical protein
MTKYILQITPESSELVKDDQSKGFILEAYRKLEMIAERDFDSFKEVEEELKKADCRIDSSRPTWHNPESDEGLPFYFYSPRPRLMGKIRVKGKCRFGLGYIKDHIETYNP